MSVSYYEFYNILAKPYSLCFYIDEVLWYTSQFILKNVYFNRHLTRDDIIRNILIKPKELRNLFDVRYLQSNGHNLYQNLNIGRIWEYSNSVSSKNFFNKLIEEGNFDLSYNCLKEFRFKHADAGQSIIRYGELGQTFYIIIKGAVDVYIPNEVKVGLSVLELGRLIKDHRDMIIDINGQVNFSMPYLTAEQKLGKPY